jgi:hypothetical protein
MLFVFGVLAVSGLLMASHVASWRSYQQEPREKLETDYRERQYRRRFQISAMLGVAGVAMLIGLMISWRHWPNVFVLWWMGVVILVGWIILLAMIDALATQRFFRRVRQARHVDEVRWQKEFKRKKSEQTPPQ